MLKRSSSRLIKNSASANLAGAAAAAATQAAPPAKGNSKKKRNEDDEDEDDDAGNGKGKKRAVAAKGTRSKPVAQAKKETPAFNDGKPRCSWLNSYPDNELYKNYHDNEWGVLHTEDTQLFELLTLEGAQAGLSWYTILKKREFYRKAFHNFKDLKKISMMTEAEVQELLQGTGEGIVKHGGKIRSVFLNAKLFKEIQKEYGSFYQYQQQFVPAVRIRGPEGEIKATTEESDAFSKDLKKRGFKFVGSTILYAYMQATGMVDDHSTACFRHSLKK